jgi:SagB-type dehydrogenase family enzyme
MPPPTLSARLVAHVTFDARTDGTLAACFDGHSVGLGRLSAAAAERAQDLRTGLPLSAFASDRRPIEKEIQLLARRLAAHGLLEYCLAQARTGADAVIIEPQVPDYWPRLALLGNADIVVLSRFAYMRRRGNELVLESPRAGALFKICNPNIAAALAMFSAPQQIGRFRRQKSFPGLTLLALLLDCHILFKVDPARGALRSAEGDDSLVLWDFHDLLFHARSTQGRHANPLGAAAPYADTVAPMPAVRPRWPGKKIDLRKLSTGDVKTSAAKLLRERHSIRSFDDRRPLALVELARFLDASARVHSRFKMRLAGDHGPVLTYAARPYPSAGATWELELYLAVDKCEGLARGFYHYDAGAHALVPIPVRAQELEAMLQDAEFAMAAPAAPQVLITIAARFARVAWKYSSLAYALMLKDVGVLMQTLYLMATDMGLGGCAVGTANIDLFAKMTGIAFHVEGPLGQFALGRPKEQG